MYTASNISLLSGFDVDYLRLLLGAVVTNATYSDWGLLVYQNYEMLYMGLRDGVCTAAVGGCTVTGSTMLPCASGPIECPVPSGGFVASVSGDDYASGALAQAITAQVCCLQYSVPYVTSHFVLASLRPPSASVDPLAGLFCRDVLNVVTALATGAFGFAIIMFLVERDSTHEDTGSKPYETFHQAAFWALMATTLKPDIPEVPFTHHGRFMSFVATLYAIVGLSVLNAVITTKFVIGSTPATPLSSLEEVTGTLCIETAYPLAVQYVEQNAPQITKVVQRLPRDCIAALRSGEAQAYLDDDIVINWYLSNFGTTDVAVSPPLDAKSNYFGIVFSRDAASVAAKLALDPLTWQTRYDPMYSAIYTRIYDRYFKAQPKLVLVEHTEVYWPTLVSMVVVGCFLILWWFRSWHNDFVHRARVVRISGVSRIAFEMEGGRAAFPAAAAEFLQRNEIPDVDEEDIRVEKVADTDAATDEVSIQFHVDTDFPLKTNRLIRALKNENRLQQQLLSALHTRGVSGASAVHPASVDLARLGTARGWIDALAAVWNAGVHKRHRRQSIEFRKTARRAAKASPSREQQLLEAMQNCVQLMKGFSDSPAAQQTYASRGSNRIVPM